MSAQTFRFDPPALVRSAALDWVLTRAFAPPGASAEEPEGGAAVDLAKRLGLAPRIAARHGAAQLAGELGGAAADLLRRVQFQVVAAEMLLDGALAAFDVVAAELRVPYAPLKGRALVLGGYCRAGGRASSDVDLLVPEDRLDALQRELAKRDFEVAGQGYEHQAPALRYRQGGTIELHRMLLGVRLSGKRSATYADLSRAERLAPAGATSFELSGTGGWRPRGDLKLPSREILAAHALVHGISQHGLAPNAYPALQVVGDLTDLGLAGPSGRGTLAALFPWIERAVSFEEAQAAFDLAAALATGLAPSKSNLPDRARRLLDHFVVGALDPRYAESLKTQALDDPLSDRSKSGARAALVAGALVPARRKGGGKGAESWPAYIARLAGRPFDLLRRWRSAKAAGRR